MIVVIVAFSSSSSVSLVMFSHLEEVLNVTRGGVSPTRLSRTKSSFY
jgi:hypothetical protein